MVRKSILCLVALMLMIVPMWGCGTNEEPQDKVTIKIGSLMDLTGPTAMAYRTVLWAIQDIIQYVNEEDPISGVILESVVYDTKYDPSRSKPGYDWLRSQGCVCITGLTGVDHETLAPFSEVDRFPIFGFSMTEAIDTSPGWTFSTDLRYGYGCCTALDWLSEDWDYSNGKPKVGAVGWNVAVGVEIVGSSEQYCQDHADDFEWVYGALTPPGTLDWYSEIEKLKDCDFIMHGAAGSGSVTFAKQFAEKGYPGRQVFPKATGYLIGSLVDEVGAEAMDGTLFVTEAPMPVESYTWIETYKSLLYAKHADDADTQWNKYCTYLSVIPGAHLACEIIRQAVSDVGADKVDSESIYDAILDTQLDLGSGLIYSYGEGKHSARDAFRIWEYDGDLLSWSQCSEWLTPVVS